MIRRTALLAGLLVAAPAYAAPGDLSVAAYLAKADALKAKGMMAMMSSDVGLLRDEVGAAGKAYRARLAADKKAGNPPLACVPERMGINADQLLTHLRGYPVAQRPKITIKVAMADWIERTYPCR